MRPVLPALLLAAGLSAAAQPVKDKKTLTFAEAWTEAVKLADATDKAEPALSEKAFKVLTADERAEALAAMSLAKGDLPEANRKLVKLGFSAWAARASRHFARKDPDFKAVAEKLWDRDGGPREILMMMNVWGAIHPFDLKAAVKAVKDNTPTASLQEETRDVIILLRGEKWLRR
jgi:hypothetical protein